MNRRPPTRRDKIDDALADAQRTGAIRGYYLTAPRDSYGVRYVVSLPGGVSRTFRVGEVETFLLGVKVGQGGPR